MTFLAVRGRSALERGNSRVYQASKPSICRNLLAIYLCGVIQRLSFVVAFCDNPKPPPVLFPKADVELSLAVALVPFNEVSPVVELILGIDVELLLAAVDAVLGVAPFELELKASGVFEFEVEEGCPDPLPDTCTRPCP